ncbi:MAG: hypothetical protein HQ500_02780 [Flavobacteriales bacterium]|nr:hypothetical protein [Flavobacteriales bacterium]
MAELNEPQIELVSAYIRQHGVASDDLHDDLLDHVCTSIENLIDGGSSFEEAFAKTIKLFGPGGLKQVQQQTFELLTEMNVTMKKTAFSFGLTSTFLLLAGTIFKLLHLPGAAVMLVLGAGVLALIYLPLLLWHKLKESPSDEYLLHISGFVGLTLTTVGVLFKIMHWPGAAVMLLGGISALAVAYVPVYFFKKYKTSANKSITLSSGLVAMTCLILVFGMMSFNRSENFNRGLSLVGAELDASATRAANNAALYAKLQKSPESEAVKSAVSTAINRVEGLRLHLIAETEGISLDEARAVETYSLTKQDNYDIPTHILFGDQEERSANALLGVLEEFQGEMLQAYDPVIRDEMEAILPFDFNMMYEFRGNEMDWVTYHFYHIPLSSVISQLSKMQLDIRNAETQVLLYLLSQPTASGPPSGS